MKKQTLIFVLIGIMISTNLFAQDLSEFKEVKNAKDYALVSRFKGSKMVFYKETKWDTYKLPVYENNTKKFNYEKPVELEGKIMRWQYVTTPDNNPAYVMKNFEKAFKKAGYKILLEGRPGVDFDGGSAGNFYYNYYGNWEHLNLDRFGFSYKPIGSNTAIIIAKTNKNGNNIYIVEVISSFSNVTIITQDIIEVEAAETGKITAKNIAEGITANGHIAIYNILFDTGKSTIKPESADALKNIAEYLNSHKDKKFIIVGHTDNTGDFETNVKLSLERAKSVMNELVSKYGVDAKQLRAYGDGQTAPIASNSTEEGKAKNRRVEIVEQ
jgi:outer membrane protein OmpA-like peptidoglycan-associated protein